MSTASKHDAFFAQLWTIWMFCSENNLVVFRKSCSTLDLIHNQICWLKNSIQFNRRTSWTHQQSHYKKELQWNVVTKPYHLNLFKPERSCSHPQPINLDCDLYSQKLHYAITFQLLHCVVTFNEKWQILPTLVISYKVIIGTNIFIMLIFSSKFYNIVYRSLW